MLDKASAEQLMNEFGERKKPFFFLIDFEMERIQVYGLNAIPHSIRFNVNGISNYIKKDIARPIVPLKLSPMSIGEYSIKFDKVKDELQFGNSFLTNLTVATSVFTHNSLMDFYSSSDAKYMLYIEGDCVVFSPETFIKIINQKVYAYPMKGTIDASIPDAKAVLMNDKKEIAEHCTIVDLIRNDLSMIAKKVKMTKFRYLDLVHTDTKDLWQASSEICGELPDDYRSQIGTLLLKLLPAGSISGAPKAQTIKIIQEVEGQKRGYYTGIMGVFDGSNLDSGVLIRYIEKDEEQYRYRSGGGITALSKLDAEYQEHIDKIYVPIRRNH